MNEKARIDLRASRKYWLWMDGLHGWWIPLGLISLPASPQFPRQTSSPLLIPLEFDNSKTPLWLRSFSQHSQPQPKVTPSKQQASGDKVCVHPVQLWCPASTQELKRKVTNRNQRREQGQKCLWDVPHCSWEKWRHLEGELLGEKVSFSMLFQRREYLSGLEKSQVTSGTTCSSSFLPSLFLALLCLKYSRYPYSHN